MFPAPISQYQSPRTLHHLHVPAPSDPPPPVSILLDSRSPLISSSRIKPRHTQHFTTTLERSTTNSADLNFAHYNYHCYLPSSHCTRSFCLSPGGFHSKLKCHEVPPSLIWPSVFQFFVTYEQHSPQQLFCLLSSSWTKGKRKRTSFGNPLWPIARISWYPALDFRVAF